jgi:protein-disulfide isomerase
VSKQTKKAKSRPGNSGGVNKSFYLIIPAVVALGGVGLLLAGMNREKDLGPISLADTEVVADPGVGISEGPEDAPAILVEFSDYQCPHCASFNGFAAKLLRQNYVSNGMLRWTVYEFPLDHFANAIPAAIAARCAGDQGRFWEMRDMLFGNQREWAVQGNPRKTFAGYATDMGLDKKQFASCLSDREHLAEIAAAKKYGESLGVSSTPTLFFNGQRVAVPTYEALEEQIMQAVADQAAAAAGETEAVEDAAGS